MPYKLRKAPNRNLYWVVTIETKKKHSREPIPLEKAKAQLRILEQALKGGARVQKAAFGEWFVLDHFDRPIAVYDNKKEAEKHAAYLTKQENERGVSPPREGYKRKRGGVGNREEFYTMLLELFVELGFNFPQESPNLSAFLFGKGNLNQIQDGIFQIVKEKLNSITKTVEKSERPGIKRHVITRAINILRSWMPKHGATLQDSEMYRISDRKLTPFFLYPILDRFIALLESSTEIPTFPKFVPEVSRRTPIAAEPLPRFEFGRRTAKDVARDLEESERKEREKERERKLREESELEIKKQRAKETKELKEKSKTSFKPKVSGRGRKCKLNGGITLRQFNNFEKKYSKRTIELSEMYKHWSEFILMLTSDQVKLIEETFEKPGMFNKVNKRFAILFEAEQERLAEGTFGTFKNEEEFRKEYNKIHSILEVIYSVIRQSLLEVVTEKVAFPPMQVRPRGRGNTSSGEAAVPEEKPMPIPLGEGTEEEISDSWYYITERMVNLKRIDYTDAEKRQIIKEAHKILRKYESSIEEVHSGIGAVQDVYDFLNRVFNQFPLTDYDFSELCALILGILTSQAENPEPIAAGKPRNKLRR
jgi:hypothetical protein